MTLPPTSVGIITDSADSLFTYDQSDSFNTYYQPNYVPAFEIAFDSSSLQSDAMTLCQNNTPCLFDIAATGEVEVGVATLNDMENIDMINKLSRPGQSFTIIYRVVLLCIFLIVVCDPSCVHGACVDTNRCHCSYGYQGNNCDTPSQSSHIYMFYIHYTNYVSIIVYEECSNESNPCLNNGDCSLHLFNYICSCPTGFTGQYCETGKVVAHFT